MSGKPLEPQKTKAAAPDQENTASENFVPKNHKALTADSTVDRVLQSKSSNSEAQRARVLELLKISPQTTYSLRAKGISHAAARVMELRRAGYSIIRTSVNAVDSDSYTHIGVALYSLEVSA